MAEKPASEQIDDIIKMHSSWKAKLLTQIRAAIKEADPEVVEEIKWRMATRPEGLAVWSHNGIVCRTEIFNNDFKLVFSKGAVMKDANKLFNARMKSKTERAIEYRDGSTVDTAKLKELVVEAVELNVSSKK